MKLLPLLALLPSLAQATGYWVEGGDLRRSNRAQSPSSIQGPVREQWSATMAGAGHPRNHPLVLQDKVIAVTDGRLAAFDRKDGQQLWSTYSVSTGNTATYDPQRGLIYVISAYGSPTAYRASDGAQAWYRSEASAAGIVNSGSCTLAEGKLIYGTAGKGLVAIDPDTHAELWRWNGGTSWTTAAYEDGRIYAASANGSVVCLNAATGQQLWHQSSPGSQYSTNVTLGDELLYVMTYPGKVEARRRDNGSLAWSYATANYSSSNLAICGDILVIASDDRSIYGVDAKTGVKRWSRSFWGNFAECAPIVVCGVIFVTGCTGEYYALDGKNGDVLWTFNHDVFNSFVDWAVDGDQLFVMDRARKLHCFVAIEPGDPSDCVCELKPQPTRTPAPGPCEDPASPRPVLWLDARSGVSADANGYVDSWRDLSGLGHHAVNGGGRRPRLGAPDAQGQRWVEFDGLDDVLNVNRSNNLMSAGNTMTLVMRLKPRSNKAIERFIGSWDHFGGTQFWFGLNNGAWQVGPQRSSALVSLGAAQTVSLRLAPGSTRLQVDGAQVVSSAGQFFDRDSAWYIGRQTGNEHYQYFKGDMAQVLVFDGALSDAELAQVEGCLGHDPAPTATPTPTLTTTPTVTLTASPTATATPTASPSATVTLTASPSSTPSPSATVTATVTATPTQTPDWTHTATPTAVPPDDDHCPATIEGMSVVPNPWTDSCQRRVCKVKLSCDVDKLEVDLYTPGGSKVCSLSKAPVKLWKGEWVELDFPAHLKLPNGRYYCQVRAKKGISQDSKTKTVVMLR